ncbi:hypothetical protein [Geoalkalibacter halelectricus]|uniref:hypothetical protein n=1 Tax=Geoalkalibacter halelectricus TaxID=2847045 RepID=UPI003D19E7DA
MFLPDEARTHLPIATAQVVRLLRSINPVAVALTGYPGQRAGAFLCVFTAGEGVRVSVVLELFDSRRLLFYNYEQERVEEGELDAVVDEGLYFVESMGFLMTDLELQTLPKQQREQMWRTLPLAAGILCESPNQFPVPGSPPVPASTGSAAGHLPVTVVSEAFEARRQRLVDSVGRMLAAF